MGAALRCPVARKVAVPGRQDYSQEPSCGGLVQVEYYHPDHSIGERPVSYFHK